MNYSLITLLVLSFTFQQSKTYEKTVTVFNDSTYKLTLYVFDPGSQDEEKNNATITLSRQLKNKRIIIFRDSVYTMFPGIDWKDYNNDKVKDIAIFYYTGARANETYHLYLVNNKMRTLTRVKGFEKLPNPSLDIKLNIITSLALYGKQYNSFYRINANGKLINLGHGFEEETGEDSGKYEKAIRRIVKENKINSGTAQKTKKWIVDDYPVPNKMFEPAPSDKASTYEMVSGKVRSLDKVWLTNDSLKQTLVFELYTDYYRNIIFHFMNNQIPPGLIKELELNDEEGMPVTDQKKKAPAIKNFIKASKKISQKYFKSNKGLRLGDSKDAVLKLYGKPDKTSTANNLEVLTWEFAGEDFYDKKKDRNKKIAESSFGHQVTMYFKENKLIAMILHNDIP